MKLYITPTSPFARMVRIVVVEKGLESRVEIIVARTRTADSPYYRINPSGRVPYLVRDDGVGLEESALICSYLDRLDGKPVFELSGEKRRGRRAVSKRRHEACWTGSRFGTARWRGPAMNVLPRSSGTRPPAPAEWQICGRQRSIIL